MELLQGTLDMLVMWTLDFGSLHRYGIVKAIRQTSDDSLQIEFGSLFPALRRLRVEGLDRFPMGDHQDQWRTKMYRLNTAGPRQPVQEQSKWARFVEIIAPAMNSTPKRAG